jgi:hypothetical protein
VKHKLPSHTSVTDLSQDELRLLDVLFDCCAPISCLYREQFVATWNSRPHNLDDIALQNTVEALCDRRILSRRRSNGVNYVGMTEYGGRLWSSERCPAWERYASERYGQTISGKPFVTIVATAAAIRDDLLRLCGPGGSWQLDKARIRLFEIARHTLIPWRSFPSLFVGVVVDFGDETDWATLKSGSKMHEEGRTWWRNTRELQKFVAMSA